MRLDEERTVEIGFAGPYGTVEALYVPDLDDAMLLVRQPDQFVCFGGRRRDRLFDQYVAAAGEGAPPDCEVGAGRDSDRNGLHILQQLVEGGIGTRLQLGRDMAGALGIDVVNAHQPRVWKFPQQPRVVEAEASDSDYAYLDSVHWLVRRRLPARWLL
jgi:hypothetical protein